MIQIVNAGVDTLYTNIYYTDDAGKPTKRDLSPSLALQLEDWKRQAQSISQPCPTSWVFNGAFLHAYPNGVGRGQFPWMLRTDDITLSISQGHWNGIATVRFNSEYLWSCRGLADAIVKVNTLLFDIFEDTMHVQPSQIDLCADIAGWDDIADLDRQRNFVTRSRKRTVYAEPEWSYDAELREHSYGLHETGFDFSRRGPMSCKIYDKTREMKQSGKEWFADLWRARGWNETKHPQVWRDEFSFGREVLRELRLDGQFHGIEDAYRLPDLLEMLWVYAAGHVGGGADGLPDGWLRCVLPTKDKNRARWPTHPAWVVVQSAFADPVEGPQHFGTIIRKSKEDRNIQKGIEAMMGYATSLASWVGGPLAAADTDLSLFLHWFAEKGLSYLERKDLDFADEVLRKRIKKGLQGETFLPESEEAL